MRNWMQEQRKVKGLTMKDVAAKLGISESYYCAIENGERKKKLDLPLVVNLSSIFGISVTKIANLEKGERHE